MSYDSDCHRRHDNGGRLEEDGDKDNDLITGLIVAVVVIVLAVVIEVLLSIHDLGTGNNQDEIMKAPLIEIIVCHIEITKY